MVSAKQLGRWRPARRQQIRWNRGVPSLQVGENFFNNHWIFDAGDNFHRAAAFPAGFDVDAEYALQVLSPGHGCPRFGGRLVLLLIGRLGYMPLPFLAGVTAARCLLFAANTSWKRVRLTRGFGTSAASLAMKSSGSQEVATRTIALVSPILTYLPAMLLRSVEHMLIPGTGKAASDGIKVGDCIGKLVAGRFTNAWMDAFTRHAQK